LRTDLIISTNDLVSRQWSRSEDEQCCWKWLAVIFASPGAHLPFFFYIFRLRFAVAFAVLLSVPLPAAGSVAETPGMNAIE